MPFMRVQVIINLLKSVNNSIKQFHFELSLAHKLRLDSKSEYFNIFGAEVNNPWPGTTR
jgi:hypothetical protein